MSSAFGPPWSDWARAFCDAPIFPIASFDCATPPDVASAVADGLFHTHAANTATHAMSIPTTINAVRELTFCFIRASLLYLKHPNVSTLEARFLRSRAFDP